MKSLFLIGLALVLGGQPANAQPHIYTIGLVFTDLVEQEILPVHLAEQHPRLMLEIERAIRDIFTDLGRFRVVRLRSIREARDPTYRGEKSIDYIAHFTFNKAHKTYHNQVIHYYENLGLLDDGGPSEDQSYTVISLPSIVCQLEVKLEDLHRDKIFWSDLRDSSAVIPYDEQLFLYNTWKYPGASHPGLTQAFLADLLRLQMADPCHRTRTQCRRALVRLQAQQRPRRCPRGVNGTGGQFSTRPRREFAARGPHSSPITRTGKANPTSS